MNLIKTKQVKFNDSTLLISTVSFFSFIAIGFIDNIRGSSLSGILNNFNINYIQFSLLSLIGSITYFAACFYAGIIANRLNNKKTLLISSIMLIFGMLLFSSFRNIFFFIIAMPFMSLGIGTIQIITNSVIAEIHPDEKGKYLNLLNFSYGIGAMIGPAYAGKLIGSGFKWQLNYHSAIFLISILSILFIIFNFNKKIKKTKAISKKINIIDFNIIKNDITFYIIITIYVMLEMSIGVWLVEYLQKSKQLSIITSSLYLSIFYGLIASGRFFGSFFIEKFNYITSLLFSSVIAIICILLGIFGPVQISWLLPLSGLFLSIIYPTTAAIVSSNTSGSKYTTFGLLMFFSGIGGMSGPFIIGIISGFAGITIGFGIISLLIISISILLLFHSFKYRNIINEEA